MPIVILSTKRMLEDRVTDEIGADDYIVKPFEPREMIARVRAQLRRSTELSRDGASTIIRVGPRRADTSLQDAVVDGTAAWLTQKEVPSPASSRRRAGGRAGRGALPRRRGVGVGFVSWAYATARVPVSFAASTLYAVPVVAAIVAWLWLGEAPAALGGRRRGRRDRGRGPDGPRSTTGLDWGCVPTFCRHNRLEANCPICSRRARAGDHAAAAGGGPSRRAVSTPSKRRPPRALAGDLAVRRMARAADDGYENDPSPACGRRSRPQTSPTSSPSRPRGSKSCNRPARPLRRGRRGARRRGGGLARVPIAYLSPLESDEPFAEIERARTTGPRVSCPTSRARRWGPAPAHEPSRGTRSRGLPRRAGRRVAGGRDRGRAALDPPAPLRARLRAPRDAAASAARPLRLS